MGMNTIGIHSPGQMTLQVLISYGSDRRWWKHDNLANAFIWEDGDVREQLCLSFVLSNMTSLPRTKNWAKLNGNGKLLELIAFI